MNFLRHYATYDEYSLAQTQVANHLASMMESIENTSSPLENILEIGCGTGIFTKLYSSKYTFHTLDLNDIFDTRKYLTSISYDKFYLGNIEEIPLASYSMVLSSSALQWIGDLERLIKKIASSTKKFYFSMYIEGNLIEIKRHFGISLAYKTEEQIKNICQRYFSKVKTSVESIEVEFASPLQVLRHLQGTGVCLNQGVSIKKIRSFRDCCLTYQVGYFICQND